MKAAKCGKVASGATGGIGDRVGCVVAVTLLITGCAFGGGPRQIFYMLEDGVAATQATGARGPVGSPERDAGGVAAKSPRVLIIAPVSAQPLLDGSALVYAPAPGQRAQYQFARWTERPSQRVARLLEARLAASRVFDAVAQQGSGVSGDLLLVVDLEQLVHDTTTRPGTARVKLRAELIDRHGGILLARRAFASGTAVASEDAAGAVGGLSASLRTVLDALVAWVETTAGGWPREGESRHRAGAS